MKIQKLFVVSIVLILCCIAACSKSTEPKIEYATVIITLSTFDGESVVGAVVTLANNNGNPAHIHEQIASSKEVSFTDVLYGTYTLTVTHIGYQAFTNSNTSVQTAIVQQQAFLREPYTIGSLGPAGGIVFYDKGFFSSGWQYMEAAPASSEFNAQWGAWRQNVDGTQMAIGSGRMNTSLIVSRLAELGETGRAAQLSRALNINGFSDWFLPSLDELKQMYENLHLQDLGDFGQGTNEESWLNWVYWSSSQHTGDLVWNQYFDSGLQFPNLKYSQLRVRAVRTF